MDAEGCAVPTMEDTRPVSGSDTARLHPDDVLLGLLVLGHGTGGTPVFPASSPRLHMLFNALRSAPEAAGILDGFDVLEGAPYPYSPQLARSLSHLERSRLIGKHNPDFEHFFVESDAAAIFDQVVASRLPAQARERLAALADRFWESATRN